MTILQVLSEVPPLRNMNMYTGQSQPRLKQRLPDVQRQLQLRPLLVDQLQPLLPPPPEDQLQPGNQLQQLLQVSLEFFINLTVTSF